MVTDYPLSDILHNLDSTERISKWAVELDTLNIDFKPHKVWLTLLVSMLSIMGGTPSTVSLVVASTAGDSCSRASGCSTTFAAAGGGSCVSAAAGSRFTPASAGGFYASTGTTSSTTGGGLVLPPAGVPTVWKSSSSSQAVCLDLLRGGGGDILQQYDK
jgi:hypothetical protein